MSLGYEDGRDDAEDDDIERTEETFWQELDQVEQI